jgi:hypothetical protein
MCVVWIDGNVLEWKPRKAERITMAMVHGKRGRTKRGKTRDDRITNLPSVGAWMSVEPKPVEMLVELIQQTGLDDHLIRNQLN